MSVQLKHDFAASVRRQLDRYAVWEPGEPFALGDYGVLRDKTLHKLGNIRAFSVTFATIRGAETHYQFASQGTSLIGAHANASLKPFGLSAPVLASLELRFSEDHGIFIRAERSRVSEIGELRQVALKLRDSGQWDFGWKLVTELREVNPATIIMGSSAGSSLKIEGASDLLEQFNIGALKAGATIAFTGEAALQVVGIVGPIFLDLCYLPRFWRGDISKAAVPVDQLPEEPYVRLSANPRIEDD